jgi:hypothetical protein
MTKGENTSDDLSVSARIPTRTVLLIVGSVLFGGVGVGSILPPKMAVSAIQSCHNDALDAKRIADIAVGIAERSASLTDTLKEVVARNGRTIADENIRISNGHAAIEALRVDIIERTTSRYTQEDAHITDREQDRKHDAIEREIDAMMDDLVRLKGWHGQNEQ